MSQSLDIVHRGTHPCEVDNTVSFNLPLTRAMAALAEHRFFKLICGGSLTEAEWVGQLAYVYALAGVDCIDIAPDPVVLRAVDNALNALPSHVPHPLVMVSLALDEDPHFRKAVLEEESCIDCMVCVPVCPTEAILTVSTVEKPHSIALHDPLCYGCGRCIEVCPTEALRTERQETLPEIIQDLLNHPRVGAVELHSQSLEVSTLSTLIAQCGLGFKGKLMALCYRPDVVPHQVSIDQEADFLRAFDQGLPEAAMKILQIDGKPMSGSDHPDASKPSLKAARQVWERLQSQYPHWPITISGGINQQTAMYLHDFDFQFIAGVGMGTVARQALQRVSRNLSKKGDQALQVAQEMVHPFQNRIPTVY